MFVFLCIVIIFLSSLYSWLKFFKSKSEFSDLSEQFFKNPILNVIAFSFFIILLYPYASSFYDTHTTEEDNKYSKSLYTTIHFLKAKHPDILNNVNLVYADQNVTYQSLDNKNQNVTDYLKRTLKQSFNSLEENLSYKDYQKILKDTRKLATPELQNS